MFAIIKRTWDLVLVARGKTWTYYYLNSKNIQKQITDKEIVLLDNN